MELSFRLSQQIFSSLALWIGGKLTIRISSSLLRGAPESVSAKYIVRLSEREVPGSIFSDFNVCFDFPLIRVAIALNTHKMEH